MSSVIFTFEYAPKLSELESDAFFEVWVSGITGAKAYRTIKERITRLYLSLPPMVPTDVTVHVQAFSHIRSPDDGKLRRVEAGYTEFDLQTLVSARKPLVRVALVQEPGKHETRDLVKGTVLATALFSSRPNYYTNRYFITPARRANIVELVSKYNERVQIWRLDKESVYSEIDRVYMREYNPTMFPMPTGAYFWMRDLAPPPPELCYKILRQVGRFRGWSERTFAAHLRAACKGPQPKCFDARETRRVWDSNALEAIDAFCEALTLVCNAVPYISDFAVVHQRGKAELTIVEAFDDALRRRAGDCEDLVRIALYFFRHFASERAWATELEEAAHELASMYDGYATLMSVMGAKIADRETGPLKVQLDDEAAASQVGAHMRGTLLPKDGAMPVLLLEGTGPMRALQNTRAAYTGGVPLYSPPPLELGPKWHERLVNARAHMDWRELCNGFYRVDATYFPIEDGAPAMMPTTDGRRGISVFDLLQTNQAGLEPGPAMTEEEAGFVERITGRLAPGKVPKVSAATDNVKKVRLFRNTCRKPFAENDENEWNYHTGNETILHAFATYADISIQEIIDLANYANRRSEILAAKLIFTPLDGELSILTIVVKVKTF